MHTVTSASKNAIHNVVRFLNRPLVKDGVKNIAGTVTFAFGLVELYDISQILKGREISTETYSEYPKWARVANKVVIVCAKLSLILSAGVSRPGVYIISTLVRCFFSSYQLKQVFGHNTTFAINPWHPRHIVSIVAVTLALPSLAQSAYKGSKWVYKKIQNSQTLHSSQNTLWLTDAKIRLMNLFNTATSRPLLHIGNQFGRYVLTH